MRIAITGMGVHCPIGQTLPEMLDRLKSGKGAIRVIEGFDTSGLAIRHAAEVPDYRPEEFFTADQVKRLDRTAQFGILAARRAASDAQLSDADVHSTRTALVVGICAGGQGKPPHEREEPVSVDVSEFPDTALHVQTDNIAADLRIHGPRATLSTACASSGSALGYAYELLRSGRADRVIVGGADALSISTYAGFYALGAMAPQPTSPFSEGIGVSFGEGAGFVVIEPLDQAQQRNARIYGEFLGYGLTGDAHHVTSPHPGGEGLARAMKRCLDRAGISVTDVDYINAHGTGTRDNDTAETQAIRQLFNEPAPPPVSSTKSYFGHTLGAAGILEFITSVLAMNEGFIPPTINFEKARPGCELDYVPNEARPGSIRAFVSNSSAFGGVNCAVAAGAVRESASIAPASEDEIWLTGIGIVSPIGCGIESFQASLLEGKSGIRQIDRFPCDSLQLSVAALVDGFNPRKLAPTLDIRRAELITRYAMVASGLALQHARFDLRSCDPTRQGLVTGLTYGSIAVQKDFQDTLDRDGLEKMSAKYFPSMVLSTIGGQVSQAFNIKGVVNTIVDGYTAGLTAIAHAYDLLRFDTALDSMVVVATDELGLLYQQVFEQRGQLASSFCSQVERLMPYVRNTGMILGEGAGGLVLERASAARARGAKPLARIASVGWTADSNGYLGSPDSEMLLAEAMQKALHDASINPTDIGWVIGHGRGEVDFDERELRGIRLVFGERVPALTSLAGIVGSASSSIGTFSVAAAALGLQLGKPLAVAVPQSQAEPQLAAPRFAMVVGSTEHGNNRAIVLEKLDG